MGGRKKPPPASHLTAPALRRLVRSYLRRLDKEHLNEAIEVVFDRRLRTSLGRADPSARKIHLNPQLLARHPEELRPTLAHELCHLVAGYRAGHGPRWQELMRVCGFPPEVHHDLDVSGMKLNRRAWTWRCRRCGETYRRKTRATEHYRCGECGGPLAAENPAPQGRRRPRRRADS